MTSPAFNRTTARDACFTHWCQCDISRHRLPKGQRWVIPTGPGTYAIYINGALVYIGSSCNLRSRLRDHFRSGRFSGAVTVKIKETYSGEGARVIERRMITRLRPPMNHVVNVSLTVRGPNNHPPYNYARGW
jgi:hypothetical protein